MTSLDQLRPAPASTAGLEVRVASSLGAYAAAWDAFVLEAPVPSPFLRSWWVDAAAGAPRHLVLVLDGDELVGGLALEERRIARVSFLRGVGGGKLCPDHLDLVADPARVPEVVAALREWFVSPGARLLEVDGLVEHSRLVDALPAPSLTRVETAVYGQLAPDVDDYFASRSATFRKRVRRFERRAAEAGITWRRVDEQDLPAALAEFRRLHGARDDRRALMRHADRLEQAITAAARHGEAVVYRADRDGRCGAVLLGFGTAGRFSDYQLARDLSRDFNHVGTVVTMAALRDACEAGVSETDFLRGDEPYKRSFASEERAVLRVRAAHGVRARVLLRLLLLVEATRRRAADLVRSLTPASTSTTGGDER
ncbi:CelD/BcsL family acetyltransferase involved in cellulose biosynthesis [Nocardioides massiliensis]|uniref:CelD/BcsL family acetyltransferase involved in cellulose biosynthesis n=2 Tax=Nocardioides massiliensis TaxID=1325935 RepID=A0ABT9NM98_9ACTN|nr:GNAT family N-acetyltransferase [Nocardioides massiliensis]MDP9821547.1 CelD/BcsL family acetyltransferase involved in cellulose biosynthesis [Nocardioides massiliensis]